MRDKVLKEYIDMALENPEIASIEVTDWNPMSGGAKPVFKLVKRGPMPWQLCPKCKGDGHLGRWNSPALTSIANPTCDVCNGAKVIQ